MGTIADPSWKDRTRLVGLLGQFIKAIIYNKHNSDKGIVPFGIFPLFPGVPTFLTHLSCFI